MSSVRAVQTLATVAEELRPVCERFVAAGYRIYLVGGAVRDLLLGNRQAVDFDLTTDAGPKETKKLVKPLAEAIWTQGERFGTIGCIIDGRDYEITTHRGESYNSESRKPVVAFSDDVEVDLSRRDFTVNAMAVSLPDLLFVDPFGGREDLEERVLRTPLSAEISFTDDPLRMLRAARFMTGYGLTPVPELIEAMQMYAERLSIVSRERVRDELMKLLALKDPTSGLELMLRTALLEQFLPEVAKSDRRVQLFGIVARAHTPVVRLALLLSGEPADVATARMKSLRAPNEEVKLVSKLIGLMKQFLNSSFDNEAVRRLCFASGGDLDQVLEFWIALGEGDPGLVRSKSEFSICYDKLLESEDLGDFTPALDGQQIMEILDAPAGKRIGEAVQYLLEQHLVAGPIDAGVAKSLLEAEFS